MTTSETTAPFNFPAGQTIRLTANAMVVIGELVTLNLRPSGDHFNGPAVVVAAFISSTPGVGPYVLAVALGDTSRREVGRRYSDVLPSRPVNKCSGLVS